MLVLDLQPGVALGPFSLGSLVNDVLKLARAEQQTYGSVEVKYDRGVTASNDLLLNFPEHGFHLCFNSSTQSLCLIEVYDLSRVQVRRGMAVVGGSGHPAAFEALYDLAGPTFPGQVDHENDSYVMHWPGLLAVFPDSAHQAGSWQELPQGRAAPGALVSEAAPAATRLCIFAGSAVSLSELRQVGPPAPLGHLQVPLRLNIGIGIALGGSQQQLCFGDTPQDAWSVLGAPSGTFSKGVPTPGPASMRPGSPQAMHSQRQPPDLVADYFYNYHDRGSDLLFDGETHRIKKMVLHANAPDHASFGVYHKCHFTLPVRSSSMQQQAPASLSSPPVKAAERAAESHTGSSPSQQHPQQFLQTRNHTAAEPSLVQGSADGFRDNVSCQQQAALPVHDWLARAASAHIAFPATAPAPSVSAPPSVQQALLNDIMAMARADSADSDSSSISNQTQTHMQPTGNHAHVQHAPQSWEPSPSLSHLGVNNPQDRHGDTVHSKRHAEEDLGRATMGTAAEGGSGRSGAEEAEGSTYAGWQGYPDLTNSLAHESQLNGWDDMDPMAALSESVQMPHETLQEQLPKQATQQFSSPNPASPAAAAELRRNGHVSSSGSSDGLKQDVHSYPVSIQPSSAATLSPLQPCIAQLNEAEEPLPNQATNCISGQTQMPGHYSAEALLCDALQELKEPPGSSSSPAGVTGSGQIGQASDLLTADSPWAGYECCFGAGSQAIIHSRGTGAPFGSTRVYGYPGIVFEVTQSGRLATVTLFKTHGQC